MLRGAAALTGDPPGRGVARSPPFVPPRFPPNEGAGEGNRRFHTLCYAPGPNRILQEEIQILWDRVWRARARSIFALDPERMRAAQKEHWAILEAIRASDAEAAAAAMERHRANTLESWRMVVSAEADGGA